MQLIIVKLVLAIQNVIHVVIIIENMKTENVTVIFFIFDFINLHFQKSVMLYLIAKLAELVEMMALDVLNV